MKHTFFSFILIVMGVIIVLPQAIALERNEVDNMYKWDLTPFYSDSEAFIKDKEAFLAKAEKITDFKGRLSDSAKTLAEGLDLYYELELKIRHLESYASKLLDLDTRVSENKGYESEIETMHSRFAELSAFIEPEIISIPDDTLKSYLANEPALKVYEFPIYETVRKKAHILSTKEENILAAASDMAGAGISAYGLFTDADMPRKTITLEDGSEVKMTYPNFDKIRRSLVPGDREKAFSTFLSQYEEFQRTLGNLLYSQMKVHRFYADMRNYESTLAASLDNDDIDTDIYYKLIEAAHANLDTFHRYLKIKARALGKDKLDYTDMYVPFTSDITIEVPYEKAREMLIKALAPLGSDYVDTIKTAFKDNWIDVYPSEGKRAGAYSSGWAYDVHPYVLMNYNETYSEALTLAHELGHAMHSYNSNKNQPFPTADYTIFTAEVASTFNENLLNDYMLKKVENDDEKLYLLGNFLDGTIKGTFFRQIQFAEFELMIHQRVEKGEALTDEVLNKMYLELTRKYYGHDKGVVNVPDMIQVEWALVPHFYYNYYVFQYSTSVAAASLLAQKVIDGQPGAKDRYFDNLLKAGGSDRPVEQLKKAGADMTRLDAYNALMERANRYMDEVEKILDAKGL